MPYQHHFTVKSDDIDQMGHVNNVVYLRYVQETAEAHWKSFASDKLQQDLVWVVLRHEIDYKKPAFANEHLIGETWVDAAVGPKMSRNVVIKNQAGEILAQAKTIWCALDGQSLRPKRIDEKLEKLFIS